MKFFTIFSIMAFGFLVSAIPVDKPKSMRLDMEDLCVFCETMPWTLRLMCYAHCQDIPKNWVSNLTLNARSSAPVVSNTTSTTSLALSNFSADVTGICDFCNDIPGEPGKQCHTMSRRHAPQKKPWVPNAMWNFCDDGCHAHKCKGAYFGQCISSCLRCYKTIWWIPPGTPDPVNNDACFCPRVEFTDEYD